jgi:hypothetical protein
MFGPQHAPAGQSCLKQAWKAPRVSPAACHTPTCAKMAKINHVLPIACPPAGQSCMKCAQIAPRVPLAACHTPTFAKMAKNYSRFACIIPSKSVVNHLEYLQLPATNHNVQDGQNHQSCLACSIPQQVSHASSGLIKHPECLKLPASQQDVPEWPKSIMFSLQLAPAGQSCLKWAQKAPRVPPAACHTPTCAKMAKINHVWPTACPSRSVMPEAGLESTQSASSSLRHTNMCQNRQNNHV